MILDRIQRYLSIAFFTTLVISQALVFVAVSAKNDSHILKAILVEPSLENIQQGDSFYFQTMISQDNQNFDAVNFHLYKPYLGIDQMYEASLELDGSYKAQSIFDSSSYPVGTYYLNVVAYDYENNLPVDIYTSIPQLINVSGVYKAAAEADLALPVANFYLPQPSKIFNLNEESTVDINFHIGVNVTRDIGILRFVISSVDGNSNDGLNTIYTSDNIEGINYDVDTITYNDTVDISNFSEGDYTIKVYTDEGSSVDLSSFFRNFSVCINNCSQLQLIDPANIELNITYPDSGASIDSESFEVLALSSAPLPDNYKYIAQMQYRQDGSVFRTQYDLSLVSTDDPLHFTTNINLTNQTDLPPEGGIPYNAIYLPGDYNLTIYLMNPVDGFKKIADNIVVTLVLNNDVPEPVYEISLQDLPQTLEGNVLDLNFTTSFSANYFTFRLINLDDTTVGVESPITLVADGTSWVFQVLADENHLTSGHYSLSASASDADGHTADLGETTFVWNINSEDVPIDPENITMTAYPPSGGRLAPGGMLFASSDILDVEFILRSVGDTDLGHTLDSNYISCDDETILGRSVREGAALAGHRYCFYALISDDIAGEIINGNYNFYVQHLGTDFTVQSAATPVSYFNEANVPVVGDTIFELKDPYSGLSDQGQYIDFPFLTNLLNYNIQFKLFSEDGQQVVHTATIRDGEWLTLNQSGIDSADYPTVNNPKVYRLWTQSQDITIPAGNYYAYVTKTDNSLETNKVYFSVQDSALVDNNTDSQEEVASSTNSSDIEDLMPPIDNLTNTNLNNGSASSKVTIDYYTTCYDQGIEDEASCAKFRATMDLLDDTCIEQGIYEPAACEDYLYRIETDLECQENKIIDREDCKNYLLEKYGGQVDCQLEDRNLCNSILRNEYLSRLVSGSRLSNNINKATDSLLGRNVSTEELSQALTDNGVNSSKVLPLPASKDTKVLLARAQKEVVLEEEDKLTILNQAVIILDADGDGLSDDLEKYYGTEIDNPDTDGDNYSDGEEIKNGYDPLGPGKLLTARTNLDIVLLDDTKNIEQPKIKSKKIDKKMEVSSVDASQKEFKLTGKAEADTWVNIYLYSGLPLVMTTKTDASGNWSYDIESSLTDGHHRVFVTVNDDTGKIVKQSRPISFLIKEAQAVTADNYFDQTSSSASVKNLFIYYILGGAFLVFLALGAIVYLHKGKDQNLEV